MKFVIWGAGTMGKRLFNLLTSDKVSAFIDIDEIKRGKKLFDKPIVDFKTYKESYHSDTIIISIMQYKEVEEFLKNQNFYNYLIFDGTEKHYFEFVKKFLSKYNSKDKIGVYGINLLGMLILDHLQEKGFQNIVIVGEEKSKNNPYAHKFHFWQANEKLDYIVVTNEDYKKIAVSHRNVKIDDLSDCSSKMPEYHNPNLKKFKDIHLGERCFIVGNGPSLTYKDLECLHQHNEIAFGVNRVYRAFPDLNWRPNYFCMSDNFGLKSYGDDVKKLDLPCFFISNDYQKFWENFSDERFYQFYRIRRFEKNTLPPFSEDVSKGVYGLATVTYDCLQIAVYMGFKEIYLIGVDSNYANSQYDVKNHFIENYYDPGMKVNSFVTYSAFLAYQSARHYAERHGIKIYNATRGGKLEVFERVDFDSIF